MKIKLNADLHIVDPVKIPEDIEGIDMNGYRIFVEEQKNSEISENSL